jgi:hypothetical protein
MCHFCELKRGAITAAEHAAQLAKILPRVTRADLEKTARAILEEMLKRRYGSRAPASLRVRIRTIDTTGLVRAIAPTHLLDRSLVGCS